jgi:hypothetical protein
MSDDVQYSKDYDVGWEKWVDAYDQELEDMREVSEEEFDEEELEELGLDESFFLGKQVTPIIKSIMTPFGILPLTEQSLASRHFKFWVGHTNFMLGDGIETTTEDFEKIIGSVLGIESVDIMTSYRFRISVGKMFQDREIMNNVKERLIGFIKSIK